MNIFEKLKAKFDLENGWIPFVNEQLKWGTAFFVRITAIVLTMLFVLYLVKWSNIIKELRSIISGKERIHVTSEGSDIISSPDINYEKDLKGLTSVIKMLENKKKIKKGVDEKENKDTK